jgi:hypothetical protein
MLACEAASGLLKLTDQTFYSKTLEANEHMFGSATQRKLKADKRKAKMEALAKPEPT